MNKKIIEQIRTKLQEYGCEIFEIDGELHFAKILNDIPELYSFSISKSLEDNLENLEETILMAENSLKFYKEILEIFKGIDKEEN